MASHAVLPSGVAGASAAPYPPTAKPDRGTGPNSPWQDMFYDRGNAIRQRRNPKPGPLKQPQPISSMKASSWRRLRHSTTASQYREYSFITESPEFQ